LIGNFPAAILVDRIGAALTATIGGAILAVGSLAASFATSGPMLLPTRVLQGIGIALLVTAALRSVLRARPGQGAAMTYFTFSATLGGVFGLQSGGILTESISWRAVFGLCVAIAAILAVTSFAVRNRGIVLPGIVSTRSSDTENRPTATTYSGSIIPSLIVNFLVFVNYSVWVALPLYAERRFDASAETNANLLLVVTIMHLIVAFPAGRAIRKWGGRPIMLAGLLVSMTGTLLVLPAPGLGWLLAPLILYGAGMVAASNAGSDIVLQRAGLGSRAVGLVRLSSDLGLVLGPIIGGFLSDTYGYRAPFVALPIVTAIAVILGYRDRPRA
jgi:MFS family permease